MEQKYKIMLSFKDIVDTFNAQSGDNKDKATMIEEKTYYIKLNEIQESNAINSADIDTNRFNLGDKYIKLYENKDDKEPKKDDSFTNKILSLANIATTAYTIHGGKSYGDDKGIDLASEDSAFFESLQNLTTKYKAELAKIGNVIRVEVKYNKSEIDLSVVGKDNSVKMDRISSYSLNIIKQIARNSNNPKVTITSTTRTPMEQAKEMYNGCLEYGITEQYKLYGSNGDKVIKVYEDLHKTKTRQEIIQAMYEKIIELGAHNVSNHCVEDISKINAIDISIWRLKNPNDFKKEIQKFEKLQKLKFIDETKRQCYHIEITQP